MNGEFKLELRHYDPAVIIKLFEEEYRQELEIAYGKSAFATNKALPISKFYAGYYTNDSWFLLYAREANTLKIYVETVNRQDINILKNTINEYFRQVVGLLKRNKIKWSEPLATITLEDCQFNGIVNTRRIKLVELWNTQKEKLFIIPAGSVIASYIAFYYSVLNKDELSRDLKKVLTLALEAYAGSLIWVLIILVFSRYKNKFTFSF